MDMHATIYLVLGAAFISLNWLSSVRKITLRYLPRHFIYIAMGSLLFYSLLAEHLPDPMHEPWQAQILEYGSELIVIIALLTSGIALDRPLTHRSWRIPIRLLGVAMPVTMLLIALLAYCMFDFTLAQACLIAACLAPTDPVLAGEVQVNAPNEGGESEERFSLTAEGGLNDALAFPFVHLALLVGLYGVSVGGLLEWVLYDGLYRIAIGGGIGFGVGYCIAHYIFKQTDTTADPDSDEGLVTVAAIFLSYGLAELCNGYGFLAVFVAALTGRSREKRHAYHKRPYHFAKQLEDLLLGLVLLGVGGLIISYWEVIFSWRNAAFALLLILLVRPFSGYAGLYKSSAKLSERHIIAFFGIRGIGSIYYLAYAHTHLEGGVAATLWGPILLTILASIFIHGVSSGILTSRFRKFDHESAK